MSKNENGPVLVMNPSTRRHVNIQPLFDLAEQFEGFYEVSEELNEAARFITLYFSEDAPVSEFKKIVSSLYLFADTFRDMEEFVANHKTLQE